MSIKKRYNKWIFNRYGLLWFAKIPRVFRCNPLFSPSLNMLYWINSLEVQKAFEKGIEDGEEIMEKLGY